MEAVFWFVDDHTRRLEEEGTESTLLTFGGQSVTPLHKVGILDRLGDKQDTDTQEGVFLMNRDKDYIFILQRRLARS